jgi:hypothetical protein
LTVTAEVTVPVHPPEAAVIVYVVLTAGDAVTLVPLVELSPVPGLQVYVVPPLAVSVAEFPAQIVALFTVGEIAPPIVTEEVAVAVHPPTEVPVTVYTVLDVAVHVTLAPVVVLKPVPGLQV